MTRNWKLITIGCLLLVAAATSVAFAAGSGSTSSSASSASPAAWHQRGGGRFFGPIGDPQRFAADVAKKLGVSTQSARSALRSARADLRRERRARGGCPGGRRVMCPARAIQRMADALAAKLHRTRTDVLSAVKSVAKERVDLAVRDGFITASRGQRIKSSIDSGRCPSSRLRRDALPGGPPPPGMPQ
jgi:hypothetical protein